MCEILSSQLLRVAFLDDHDVVRCGLAVKLAEESDMVVVGNYDNSKKMMAGLRQNPADVLLIDYSLGPTEVDGVTLIRVLRAKFPASRILVVSALGDPETIALALRAGAQGFIRKNQQLQEVVQAVRMVASGQLYLPNIILNSRIAWEHAIKADFSAAGNPGETLFPKKMLSPREYEVIRCFLDGLTVSQIAEKFGRSAKTISAQKCTAFAKLGIHSDNELFKIKDKLDTR